MRRLATIAAALGAVAFLPTSAHAQWGGISAEYFARDRGVWQGDPSPYGGVRKSLAAMPRLPLGKDRRAVYARIVAAEAQRQGVPVNLALAIARQESGFNPRARSHQNAQGLMQIIPSTWRALRCTGSPWNASDNARCGVAYLAQGYREGGAAWAAARYHGGPNTRAHGVKTRHYTRSVMAMMQGHAPVADRPRRIRYAHRARDTPRRHAQRPMIRRYFVRRVSRVAWR